MHYGYILRGTVTGLYKIGITNNPHKRFSRYKTHVPERIVQESVKTFLSEEEARDWERWILTRYADRVEHGEWLNLDFDEAAAICCEGTEATWWGDGFITVQNSYDEGSSLMRMLKCRDEDVDLLLDYLNSDTFFRGGITRKLPREIDEDTMKSIRQKVISRAVGVVLKHSEMAR